MTYKEFQDFLIFYLSTKTMLGEDFNGFFDDIAKLAEEHEKTVSPEELEAFNKEMDDHFAVLYKDTEFLKILKKLDNLAETNKSNKNYYTFPDMDKAIKEVISANPGILQTALYKKFPPQLQPYIRKKLAEWDSLGKIKRIRSGHSFQLFLPSEN